MTDLTLLQSDRWRLWLNPSVGVQWQAAEVLHKGRWVAVIPDCRPASTTDSQPAPTQGARRAGQDERTPLGAACFHMLPYSNRVRDGKFTADGHHYVLEDGAKHAIHGALRKRAWRTIGSSPTTLCCEYDSRGDGPLNWPWPLQTTLRHELTGSQLRSSMTLTNAGTTPMPAGLGWHPYFVRNIEGAQPRLQLPVRGLYPDAAGDCLPDGPAESLPESLDFRSPRALDPDQRIDVCLSGLDGACEIAWPDAGLALTMTASANCTHLVLFNPDMPHFAVEPVTNANDGFNLQARGIDAGVITLAPGETLEAWLTLEVRLKWYD